MRILHVIPSVAPRYGGPSTAIVAMTSALNQIDGVDAEVLTTDHDGPDRFTSAQWHSTNTTLHLVQHDERNALGQWLTNRLAGYDLIHTHSVWNRPIYVACQAAQGQNKPVIYRPCGMLSDYSWSRKRLLRYGYWWLREQHNVAYASAFHCTSETEAGEVGRLGVARKSRAIIEVIPNGVDDAAWTVPVDRNLLRHRCRSTLGYAVVGQRKIMLFLSRLHPKKGIIDLLLPAFAEFKRSQQSPEQLPILAIVGGADDHAPNHEHEIRQAITQLGLAQDAVLLGAVPARDRWAMFDGADLFVLPSKSRTLALWSSRRWHEVVRLSSPPACNLISTCGRPKPAWQ